MSNGTEINSLDDLATVFEKKFQGILTAMKYRNISEDDARDMCLVDKCVNELNEHFASIRKEIKEGEDQLIKLQKLVKNLQILNAKLDYMQKNIPASCIKKKEKECTNDIKKSAVAEASKKPSKSPSKLQLITINEFKTVPEYLKGRIRYEEVNKFASSFNTAIEGKYKLLALPRKGMQPDMVKKIQKLKLQETAETKGLYFVTADDLKEYGNVKIAKSSENMLSIFRHCHKLKLIRGPGPIVRHTIIA